MEQVSSVAQRAELDRALDFIRVVTKLDRLARSVAELCAIENHIAGKGAALRINNMKMDTSTPTGKLMLNVLGSIAQFEREIMRPPRRSPGREPPLPCLATFRRCQEPKRPS